MNCLSLIILSILEISTLVTLSTSIFLLMIPLNFCENLESSPLSPMMVVLGSTTFVMIICGIIRLGCYSKLSGYMYIVLYVIVAIGSIVAIIFGALIFHKFDKTLKKCLLDNDIAEKRRNDPFLKWFQQKVEFFDTVQMLWYI
ncbi:hypothetical protein RF11_05733 [Thelohanellus kitauei]|uniref:Uncharacterized protein n=1 Tax=Thelohanellus kitauei TaxID=669202 RepID=A0A0C2M488_THEKT|nr:hypothetical protein RF11_05733 [Thelohanellus kitauei]